jgi:hypothetical protein
VLVSTLSIATVKYPSGSGDPIGRRTIRVIACASGSISAGLAPIGAAPLFARGADAGSWTLRVHSMRRH